MAVFRSSRPNCWLRFAAESQDFYASGAAVAGGVAIFLPLAMLLETEEVFRLKKDLRFPKSDLRFGKFRPNDEVIGQTIAFGGRISAASGKEIEFSGQIIAAIGRDIVFGGRVGAVNGKEIAFGGRTNAASGKEIVFSGRDGALGGRDFAALSRKR